MLVTLPVLQTVIGEIEAILNDRPLTYVSADLKDPEPLMPSHPLCGRRITSMPHMNTDDEISDSTFGVPPIKEIAKRQGQLIQRFQSTQMEVRVSTSLRESHRRLGQPSSKFSWGCGYHSR